MKLISKKSILLATAIGGAVLLAACGDNTQKIDSSTQKKLDEITNNYKEALKAWGETGIKVSFHPISHLKTTNNTIIIKPIELESKSTFERGDIPFQGIKFKLENSKLELASNPNRANSEEFYAICKLSDDLAIPLPTKDELYDYPRIPNKMTGKEYFTAHPEIIDAVTQRVKDVNDLRHQACELNKEYLINNYLKK